jgi:hypothetical protein
VSGNTQDEIRRISKTMGNKFRMKDLGTIKQFLGIEALHHPGGAITTT